MMRYRSNNILALIPPGKDGIQIIKQAVFLRQTLEMKVFLYRIIEPPSYFERLFHPVKAKRDQSHAIIELQKFAKKIIPKNIIHHFTYRVKSGKKLPVLLRQAKKGGYEFIIVDKDGKHGGLEADELDKLISRSVIPIMTVSTKHVTNSINDILIPVDVLKTTQKKLLWATYFAKKYNAKVTIISVLTMNIDLKQSLAWRNAEKLKFMLTQRGISCELKIIKDTNKEKLEVIVDYIETNNPDLIILRTHQDLNKKNVQIGQFVSNIVHSTNIPVFTVNRFLQPMPIDFEI